jgi:hypothetical protein
VGALAEGRGEGLFAGEIEVGDGAMTGTRDGETGGVIDGVARRENDDEKQEEKTSHDLSLHRVDLADFPMAIITCLLWAEQVNHLV